MDIRSPDLGDTTSEARVLAWKCRVGDHVRKGQEIAELEAEKTNFFVEAPADGILEAILVPVDSIIRGNVVVARLKPGVYEPSGVAARGGSEPMVRLPGASVAHPQRRCRFCNALEMSGRAECARCGAPF